MRAPRLSFLHQDCIDRRVEHRSPTATAMAKRNYQKLHKMNATEKRLRDAEAADVHRFLLTKPSKDYAPVKAVVKTKKIKDTTDGWAAAAALVQAAWRALVARKAVAALKIAVAASRKEAAAADAKRCVNVQLRSSLALIMMGQRLGGAAVVRGDMQKLRLAYGSAVATIVRGMQALVSKREQERAVVEAMLRETEAECGLLAAEIAALKVKAAEGAALKAAAQKERAMALEHLCVLSSHACGTLEKTINKVSLASNETLTQA